MNAGANVTSYQADKTKFGGTENTGNGKNLL